MIRIGPAGIPLSCKGRTLKDGIIYTKSLELDALEVQFVRGIRMTEEDAAEVGEVAAAADVELHVHAPYYTNLAGDERNLELTRDKVMKAANLANIMGAQTLVVHPGFYGERTPEEALERIVQVVGAMRDEFKAKKWKPSLAVETMGKRAVFGSLDEIIDVCKQVPGVLPVIDFAHIHARGNGSLNTVEDFQEVFDKLIPLGLDHYLIHFTGVLYENGNERHHLPIKKGDLRFEPLVDVILENDYNVTLISTSPILEHDAMYMQIVLDRVKEKREQRLSKEAMKPEGEEGATISSPAIDTDFDDDDHVLVKKKEAPKAKPEPAPAVAKAPPEPKPKPEPRPICVALTQAKTPCSNPARTGSKYCSSHRDYRPPRPAAPKKDDKKKPATAAKAPAKAPAKPPAKPPSAGTAQKKVEKPSVAAAKPKPGGKPSGKAAAPAVTQPVAAAAAKGGKPTPAKAKVAKPAKTSPPTSIPAAPAAKRPVPAATPASSPTVAVAGKPPAPPKGVAGKLKAAAQRLVGRKER